MSALSVRRPLALLAVLGMVATLLFAVAGTASAATATPEHEATFSACPDNAGIPDAGFSDIPTGSFFDDAVNCLKYYTVTTGTTPTEYSPADDVTRAQMAVFLARLAGSAGVVLDSTPPDAGFTDISELSPEAQTAINALADAGIVKGKTATTYEPAETVWRQQMALFLTRFLGKAVVGPGGSALSAATTDMAPFTDIADTTFEANVAINQAWDLGIATGTTATTFDPVGNVNRGQMASFLTRVMAQANTRPAGVNAQANPTSGNIITPQADETMSTTVSVTTRTTDGKFMPDPNTIVDLPWFSISEGDTVTTPFLADGTCNLALLGTQLHGLSMNPCTLDLGDAVTDPDGNVTLFTSPLTFTSLTQYAWTGATGEKFDVDTTQYSEFTLTPTRAADGYTFKVDVVAGDSVILGDTVTWTFQVTDEGTPLAEAGWTFKLQDNWTTWDSVAGTFDTGFANPVTTVTTDANGMATYTKIFTDANPDSADTGDWANYWLWLSAPAAVDPGGAGSAIPNPIFWYDVAPYANSITVDAATDYKVQTDGASNSVSATVLDQYGNPLPNVAVDFSSTDTSADAGGLGGPPFTRFTNSLGVASIGYTWDHTGAGPNFTAVETISAQTAGPGTVTTDFYWVEAAVTGEADLDYTPVLAHDNAVKQVVAVDPGGYYKVWTWDAGDQFRVTGLPDTMVNFETQIDEDAVTPQKVRVYDYTTAGVSDFRVRDI